MNYPLISEYIESIKSAEDNFKELSYLRPVLGEDGLPVMTSGNFAVVFKMLDKRNGKPYAIKCYTKEQKDRADSYKLIEDELNFLSSPYFVEFKFYEKELFVETSNSTENDFPVLLMEWVNGLSLDKYIQTNINNKKKIETITNAFAELSEWLLSHKIAHGDLKPDNIIIRPDDSIVLVDYDGMYVPMMYGQYAKETGTPDFSHPHRNHTTFGEYIDDFSIVTILLSLNLISYNPGLFEALGTPERLLFSSQDYINIDNSKMWILTKNISHPYIKSLANTLYQYCKQSEIRPDSETIKDIIRFKGEKEKYNKKTSLILRGISLVSIGIALIMPLYFRSQFKHSIVIISIFLLSSNILFYLIYNIIYFLRKKSFNENSFVYSGFCLGLLLDAQPLLLMNDSFVDLVWKQLGIYCPYYQSNWYLTLFVFFLFFCSWYIRSIQINEQNNILELFHMLLKSKEEKEKESVLFHREREYNRKRKDIEKERKNRENE